MRALINQTDEGRDTLRKWYEVGKVLQFVDELNLRDDAARREAFQRLFDDLAVDINRNPSFNKLTRYPNHMYRLAGLPKTLIFSPNMTWSKWFDILEYRRVYENPVVLEKLVQNCSRHNWNANTLRHELQNQNRALK